MSEDEEKKSDTSSSNDQADFPTLSRIDPVEEIGTQIGCYKLLSVLGEGGMGLVYLADQIRTGQTTGCPENHQAWDGLQAGDRPF